uniref:Mitochondrial carrier protein n=1 Tax=Brassica campestris TaxID=3711 RepID=M4CCW7_BRACM
MGGMISAGTTHLALTPLDVLKVNMQVNPVKYNSIPSGFSTLLREHGHSYLWRAWSGKLLGYGVQGGCRFGLYEYFKTLYSNVLPNNNRTSIYFLRYSQIWSFHMGLFRLWCRNLPFSMVMFSTFEQLVEFIYQNIIEKRKQDCSKAQQLGVTCLAGYTAGALGTLISDPADVVVSSHYNNKAKNVLQAVRNIGFVGLFTRSLPVRITIVGPVS